MTLKSLQQFCHWTNRTPIYCLGSAEQAQRLAYPFQWSINMCGLLDILTSSYHVATLQFRKVTGLPSIKMSLHHLADILPQTQMGVVPHNLQSIKTQLRTGQSHVCKKRTSYLEQDCFHHCVASQSTVLFLTLELHTYPRSANYNTVKFWHKNHQISLPGLRHFFPYYSTPSVSLIRGLILTCSKSGLMKFYSIMKFYILFTYDM